jgi:tetratricopeptide (TPR) repeat protein
VQERLALLRSALDEMASEDAEIPRPRAPMPTLPADDEVRAATELGAGDAGDRTTGKRHDSIPVDVDIPPGRVSPGDPLQVAVGEQGTDQADAPRAKSAGGSDRPPGLQASASQSAQPPAGRGGDGLTVQEALRATVPQDGRPATEWLDPTARAALAARAAWLEEEARAQRDAPAKARTLLTCSELRAILGEQAPAHALAEQAYELAPSLGLARRQARMLIASRSGEDYFRALDAEATKSQTLAARMHSEWMHADALRAAGQDDAYRERLDRMATSPVIDPRVAVARAGRALSRSDSPESTSHVHDDSRFAPIADALAICRRLRGARAQMSAPHGPRTPNEILADARRALDARNLSAASRIVIQLRDVPGLADAARWLAASLGSMRTETRDEAGRWFEELVERGNDRARRSSVACAFESRDANRLAHALSVAGADLASSERVVLSVLGGLAMDVTDPHVVATAASHATRSLAAAVSALTAPNTPSHGNRASRDHLAALADLSAGSPRTRALLRLARLLVMGASPLDTATAIDAVSALGDEAPRWLEVLSVEIAARAGRLADVSRAIENWGPSSKTPRDRACASVAAALLAECAGDTARAIAAYKTAISADAAMESALRALASLENDDLGPELSSMADALGDGLLGALARIEAIARADGRLPDPTRAQMLARVGDAPVTLLMTAHVAETMARRAGDEGEVVRWIRQRKSAATDAIQRAMENIREAWIVARSEPAVAAASIEEAARARPSDMALRALYERLAPGSTQDAGAWREARASECRDLARTKLLIEAAYEHEWADNHAACLRCAEAASDERWSLCNVVRERAELRSGTTARLADELLSFARGAEDARSRREAYERLATLDAETRHDPASALLWHRTILDEFPGYLPSLRHVEHQLLRAGRTEELEPIVSAIARALRGTGAGEGTAHAELALRLRSRSSGLGWDVSHEHEMVELAVFAPQASLSALRIAATSARARSDLVELLSTTLRLLDAVSRSAEASFLLVRAADAALRLGDIPQGRALLERASLEDPDDVVLWGLLGSVRRRCGDAAGAAEALESCARTSAVPAHQATAWHQAGQIWRDEVRDASRAILALENATAIDLTREDAFDDLAQLYESRGLTTALAGLIERRMAHIADPEIRFEMDLRRGRILRADGDVNLAREAFQAALAFHPDDTTALSELADVCLELQDWGAAERAFVQLTRLLSAPDAQRRAYAILGDIYSRHIVNLARAEVALQEVLRRDPSDTVTSERLIEIYRLRGDGARAVGLAQELLKSASSREERRTRMLELAALHESTNDPRRAEQVLDGARRELPDDIGILRALAEFYERHQKAPAASFMLDRAGGDVRRGLRAGRIHGDAFNVLATVCEMRGRADGAQVVRAVWSVLSGEPARVSGAGPKAFDPRMDELIAPELFDAPMRALLARTGAALEGALPVDLRALRATAVAGDSASSRVAARFAEGARLSRIELVESPKLGATCIPVGSSPPVVLVGSALLRNEPIMAFLLARAIKLVSARASALARTAPSELGVLVAGWLKCFNSAWEPQGVPAAAVHTASSRVRANLPRVLDPDLGLMALEVGGRLGARTSDLGAAALAWGDRVALLATGDIRGALDGIAMTTGLIGGAPTRTAECAAWVAQTPEALELVAFAVSEAYFSARAQSGIDA